MRKSSLFLMILFVLSCSDNKKNNTKDLNTFKQDSLKITQLIRPDFSLNELDSISYLLGKEYKDSYESKFFFAHSYVRVLIVKGNLHKADSVVSSVLQYPDLDTTSIEAARLYNLKGAIFSYRQNQHNAVTFYRKALEIFDEKEELRPAASIKFNLANMFLSQMDYESSFNYSIQASETFRRIKDTTYLPWSLAIASVSAINLNNLQEATTLADEALKLSEKYSNLMGKLLAYYALGEIEMYHENYSTAIKYFSEVVQMSEQYNQKSVLLPTKASLAKASLMKGNYLEAIQYGEAAKALADQLGNTEILYSLYKNLAFSYELADNKALAFEYLKNAEELLRLKSSRENQENIQNLLIQYESEKKVNQILIQEKALAENKLLILIVTTICLILLASFLFYRESNVLKYKLLMQMQERNLFFAVNDGEEKERKRMAYELHDGIASNLVAIKLQLENNTNNLSLSNTLDLIGNTHQEVRKIAHNLMPIDFKSQNLVEAIESFCQECNSAKLPVHFQTNSNQIHLNKEKSIVLYRTIQELIQNSLKHANAKQIDVLVMKNKSILSINIEDNGVGYDLHKNGKSKGLKGVVERIEKIDGKINIESSNAGTSAFISIEHV